MRTLIVAAVLMTAFVAGAIAPGSATVLPDSGKLDAHLRERLAGGATGPLQVIVLTHGDPAAGADAARVLGAQVTWTYSLIDGFAATLPSLDALTRLTARADVAQVWLDRPVAPVMDVSAKAIEADDAWAAGYDGAGVTVAVIDTGIDRLHPFFTGAIVACVSTIGGLTSPECTDSDGHGTHVAGTVASRDTRHRGVAPGASLAVVRVLHAAGTGTSADIIAGMDWVAANKNRVSPPIRVATMSIGYANPGCGDDSDPMAVAANRLVESGVPFTVAAGNSGHKGCTIDGASAASKVTTIAAVDDKGTITQDDDVIAGFSSGGGSKLQKPDVSFPGVAISSAYLGGLVLALDGTSMATPHAAGVAALLYQKSPGLTAQQVKDKLAVTAVKTANTGGSWNSVYGHGLGNACLALGLTTCGSSSTPPEPVTVHVGSLTATFDHGNGKNPPHRVHTTVKVVDASGAAVSGANVAVEATSPEGNRYTASGSTDGTGQVTLTVSQKGDGHGTWQSCVTGISGTNLVYDTSRNAATCVSVVVT